MLTWHGDHALIIMEINSFGFVLQHFKILQHLPIPKEAMWLLRNAREFSEEEDDFVVVYYEHEIHEDAEITD